VRRRSEWRREGEGRRTGERTEERAKMRGEMSEDEGRGIAGEESGPGFLVNPEERRYKRSSMRTGPGPRCHGEAA